MNEPTPKTITTKNNNKTPTFFALLLDENKKNVCLSMDNSYVLIIGCFGVYICGVAMLLQFCLLSGSALLKQIPFLTFFGVYV